MSVKVGINEIENRKIQSTKPNTGFFKRPTTLTNLQLDHLWEKETWISKIWDERGDITTGLTEIKRTVREHSERQYVNKLDNLNELDKLLDNTYYQNRPKNKWKIWTNI